MTTSQRELRRAILRDTDQIPTLPEVIVRVIALLNECDTQPSDLEEVLRCDPALVARVLAMVNSPFFGQRQEITSIRDAIMVLGYQNLRSLVLVTSTSKFLSRDFSCYGHDPKGLWKHAVAVAAGAKSLAVRLGINPMIREEVFIGALLHDIGKMVLHRHLSTFSQDEIRTHGTAEDAEDSLLGITHPEAGTLVAAKWNLSPLVTTIIGCHHETPDIVADDEGAVLVAIVRVSDRLSHELGIGFEDGPMESSEIEPQDLALLNLDEDAWADAREAMRTDIDLALLHLSGVAA